MYDSYGNLQSQVNVAIDCIFGFTGRTYDNATGLQNNWHRWHDPRIGAWISQDLIRFEAGDENLYRYCYNNLTMLVDPNGLVVYVSGGRNWEKPSWWPSWLFWPYDEQGRKICMELSDPSDFLSPIGMAKLPVTAVRGAWAARAAKVAVFVERHHLLPRQFARQFARVGLDIEKYVIEIGRDAHRLKPGGLHTGTANWNKMWAEFFDKYPNATKEQILEQLAKMRKTFGI